MTRSVSRDRGQLLLHGLLQHSHGKQQEDIVTRVLKNVRSSIKDHTSTNCDYLTTIKRRSYSFSQAVGWELRPNISDKQSITIAGIISAALIFIALFAFLLFCCAKRRKQKVNKICRQGSLWASTQWKRGRHGQANFVPLNDPQQAAIDRREEQTSYFDRLFRRRKGALIPIELQECSPYTYSASPRPSHRLLGTSYSSKAATSLADRGKVRSASYHRPHILLTLDVTHTSPSIRSSSFQDFHPSPTLATPQAALSSPRLRSSDDSSSYWTQRRRSSRRQSSLLSSPSVEHSRSIIEPFESALDPITEPEERKSKDLFGLGLNMEVSSSSRPSSESANLTADTLKASLLWQPLKSISTAKDIHSTENKSKGDKDGIIGCGLESIQEYTGPIYADKIADALKEARMDCPVSPFSKVPLSEGDLVDTSYRRGQQNVEVLETVKDVQMTQHGKKTTIQRSHVVRGLSKARQRRKASSQSTVPVKSASKRVTALGQPALKFSPKWSKVPTNITSNRPIQSQRQVGRTATSEFHLPQRPVNYAGSRPLCSSPETMREESVQSGKIRSRTSLMPNAHFPSASIESDSSRVEVIGEGVGYSSLLLFKKELSSSPMSLGSKQQQQQQQPRRHRPLRTWSDEERELESKETRRGRVGSKYIRRYSSHSTAVVPSRQSQSRYHSCDTISAESMPSRYSQESGATFTPTNLSQTSTNCFSSTRKRRSSLALMRIGDGINVFKRGSHLSAIAPDPSLHSDPHSYSLSKYAALTPLSPSYLHLDNQLFGSTCIDQSSQNIQSIYTTQPLRLIRRLSSTKDSSSNESRRSSRRESDYLSPTLQVLQLYKTTDTHFAEVEFED